MTTIDWTIIATYLIAVVGLGCWAGWNARRQGAQHGESVAGDYFMAAHTLRWPVIGLALFATNISCVHLISLAQSGYDSGLLNGNFEWMAAFTLILLGFSSPRFISNRKSPRCRIFWNAGIAASAVIGWRSFRSWQRLFSTSRFRWRRVG